MKLSGQPAFSREQYPYRDLARWHHNLFEAYGPGRLMWGSDFPWNLADPGYERLIGVVRELLPGLSKPTTPPSWAPTPAASCASVTQHRLIHRPAPPTCANSADVTMTD